MTSGTQTDERPVGRRERKKQQTRQVIVSAAWVLFQQKGLAATTVRDIAELADVSDTTVNNYFPTRDGLVTEALAAADLPGDLIAGIARRPPDESPWQALRAALVEAIADTSDDDLRRGHRINEIASSDPEVRKHMLLVRWRAADELTELLRERALHHGLSVDDLRSGCHAAIATLNVVGERRPDNTSETLAADVTAALARIERGWS